MREGRSKGAVQGGGDFLAYGAVEGSKENRLRGERGCRRTKTFQKGEVREPGGGQDSEKVEQERPLPKERAQVKWESMDWRGRKQWGS